MASYALFDGTGGSDIETPDHASLDITGDIDIRALLAPDDWQATQAVIIKNRGVDRSYRFKLEAGNLVFRWFDSGEVDDRNVQSTISSSGIDGSPLWIRVTFDADNGAAGCVGRFYFSTDPIETIPSSVAWIQLGDDVVDAGAAAITASIASAWIGSDDGSDRFVGKFYYAEIRTGINGTIVADPDFRDADQRTSQSPTQFTDTTGKVWTFDTVVWAPGGVGRRISRRPGHPHRYHI